MSVSERLALLITANGSQAIAEFQKTGAAAQKSLTAAQTSSQALSANLVRVGAGMAALGGVALVGLYKAAQAAEEENLAIEKLNNSLANSPELAGASADAFLDQAAALQDVTAFADDATIAAQAMLGTFHLTQDEILGLTPLVQDLAAKFDLDLNRASILVGKAMDGNVGTLQRMGVRIDEAAYATDRYDAVMTALRENAGGFAEQEGQTFNGQIQIMKNNLGDIAEGVGRGAVEAFNSLLGPVKAVSDAFEDLSPGAQSAVGKVAAFGAVGLVALGSASMLAGWIIKVRDAYRLVVPAAEAASAAQTGAATSALAAKAAMAGTTIAAIGLAAAWAHAQDNLEADFDIADLLTGTEEQVRGAAEQFQWLAESTGETGDALDAFTDLAATNIDAATRFGAAWGEAGGPVLEINRVLSEAGRAAELSALGLDESATSAEEAAAAFGQLNDRIDAYLNRIQGVEEAAAAEAEAQQAWAEALRENGATYDINTEAGRENIQMRNAWVDTVGAQIQAAMDHGEATGNYERAQRQANRAIRSAIGDLRGMRDQGLITQEQFNRLSGEIRRVPHRVPVDIDTNVEDAMVEVSGLQQSLWELERTYTIPVSIVAPQYLPGQARGGSFEAGDVHMVGEEGPELRMATGSGQTFSAAETRQMLSGGGSGTVVNITVNGDMTDRTLAKLEAALDRGRSTPVLDRKIRRLAGAR